MLMQYATTEHLGRIMPASDIVVLEKSQSADDKSMEMQDDLTLELVLYPSQKKIRLADTNANSTTKVLY